MVTVHHGISRVPGQPTFTLHPHLKLPRAPGRQIVDRGLIRSTRVDNAITGGQNTPGCCAPQIIHANERLGKLWGGTGGIPADGHKNVFHSRFPFFPLPPLPLFLPGVFGYFYFLCRFITFFFLFCFLSLSFFFFYYFLHFRFVFYGCLFLFFIISFAQS